MREKGSLAGATAIVTGASSGIGYGIASRLAVDGAAVAINYHSQREPAEQLRGEIERKRRSSNCCWRRCLEGSRHNVALRSNRRGIRAGRHSSRQRGCAEKRGDRRHDAR
jgi:NAD(P)-dependent dehydrogenase (short-subunit alcohol dehydrogenase family)